jgi:hypothetical protein
MWHSAETLPQEVAPSLEMQHIEDIELCISLGTLLPPPLLRLPHNIHEEIFFQLLFCRKSESLYEVQRDLVYYQECLGIRVNKKIIMCRVERAHIEDYKWRISITRRDLVLAKYRNLVWKALSVLDKKKFFSKRLQFVKFASKASKEYRYLCREVSVTWSPIPNLRRIPCNHCPNRVPGSVYRPSSWVFADRVGKPDVCEYCWVVGPVHAEGGM